MTDRSAGGVAGSLVSRLQLQKWFSHRSVASEAALRTICREHNIRCEPMSSTGAVDCWYCEPWYRTQLSCSSPICCLRSNTQWHLLSPWWWECECNKIPICGNYTHELSRNMIIEWQLPVEYHTDKVELLNKRHVRTSSRNAWRLVEYRDVLAWFQLRLPPSRLGWGVNHSSGVSWSPHRRKQTN